MGKIIICGSCGAEFDEDLAKCPYCDSASIKGAEREYMGKLEKVRRNMEELDNVPMEELQSTVKKQFLVVKKTILILLAAVILAGGIVLIWNREEKIDRKGEYLWQQEYFPRLSELYEDGEYDAMLELAETSLEEETHSLIDWEHYEFFNAYWLARDFQDMYEQRSEGVLHKDDYISLFLDEWSLVCLKEFPGEAVDSSGRLSERDWEVLMPYIERAGEDLLTSWGMSEQEYDDFLSLAEGNYGVMPYEQCRQYIEKWWKAQR